MKIELTKIAIFSHNSKGVSSSLSHATRFIKEFKVPWFFVFEKNGGNLGGILAKLKKRDIIGKNINWGELDEKIFWSKI